jgi:hypothetical protein
MVLYPNEFEGKTQRRAAEHAESFLEKPQMNGMNTDFYYSIIPLVCVAGDVPLATQIFS